jgi:hypothetical protein
VRAKGRGRGVGAGCDLTALESTKWIPVPTPLDREQMSRKLEIL